MSQPVDPATPETGAAPTETPVAPQAPAQAEKDWKAEAEKWQALSRKNEDAAKANADAAKKLRDIEDRDLSELQKAQRAAAETAAELDRVKAETEQLRVSALRTQVALTTGLPATLVSRLQGSSEEELTADAKALLALVQAPRTPQPDPAQGVRDAAKSDEDHLWEQFAPHVLPNIRHK